MRIAVYCGGAQGTDPAYASTAHALGSWIGKQGHELVYGGGKLGLMGILADACLAAGGQVTGIMPHFLIAREVAHHQLTQLIEVDSMATRKQMMLDFSKVCIALPGGPGTLEEIVEACSWLRVGQLTNPCVFFNVNGYYDLLKLFFEQMVTQGFLTQADFNAIHFVNSLAELTTLLQNYAKP